MTLLVCILAGCFVFFQFLCSTIAILVIFNNRKVFLERSSSKADAAVTAFALVVLSIPSFIRMGYVHMMDCT